MHSSQGERAVGPSSTRTTRDRVVIFGAPAGYIALALFHPAYQPNVGDPTTVFICVHVVQLAFIGLIAYTFWLLVRDVRNQAATVVRAGILPYVVTYTVFDSIVGIAVGMFIRQANDLPSDDAVVAQELVQSFRNEPLVGLLALAASIAWFVPAVAVALALRKVAPRAATSLMIVGAAIFALGHARPFGPSGMAFYLAGLTWLEWRPRVMERRKDRAA